MHRMLVDELEMRALLDNWAVWRDAGQWDRLATTWHAHGRMIATWFDGPASEFIVRSKTAWEKGVNVTHALGGCAIEISGDRAVAQTRMSITQRTRVHGKLADVMCTGRFYDLLERRLGRWALVVRQCIYENDRLTPVLPCQSIDIDEDALNHFPEGYRHLAYVQQQAGMQVTNNLPGRKGPEVEALYRRGREWLDSHATVG